MEQKSKIMKPKCFCTLFFFFFYYFSFAQSDLPTLIANAEKAVCFIETFDENNNPLMIGTGFFIDEDGTCVSNYHVFAGSYYAKIKTIDKNEYEIEKILKSSSEYDIIVFKIQASSKMNYLKVNNDLPLKGESIVTIGNPMGFDWSASEGIISSIRKVEDIQIMQITAPVSEGNSGGPVLNKSGKVLGITSFQLKKGQNLNFALHISVLDSIKTNDVIIEDTKYNAELPSDFEIAKATLDSIVDLSLIYPEHFTEEKILFLIDKFNKRYPSSAFGYIEKGNYYSYQLNYEKAFELYSKAIQIEPNNPDCYYERAFFLNYIALDFMKEKNHEKMQIIINDYKKYGSFSKENLFKSYHELAICYSVLGEYLKAVEYETKYIDYCLTKDDLNIANSYLIRASMYEKLKDFKNLNKDLDKAIEISPTCYAYNWKARILIKNEEFAEASKYLKDNCLDDYADYYDKALVLIKIGGDLDKAAMYLDLSINELEGYVNQGIAKRDELEMYYRLRAIIFESKNLPIETLKFLNKIIDINPKLKTDYNFTYWMIDTKYSTKDYLGTLKDVNELIESYPNKMELFDIKGYCLFSLSDYVGAIKAFSKAIELNPKEGNFYRMRGLARYYSKDKSGACVDWSKAGELGNYKAYDHIKDYCNN